jgi:hypothetical protein
MIARLEGLSIGSRKLELLTRSSVLFIIVPSKFCTASLQLNFEDTFVSEQFYHRSIDIIYRGSGNKCPRELIVKIRFTTNSYFRSQFSFSSLFNCI